MRRVATEDVVPVFEPVRLRPADRRAVLLGCTGELREQLALMLDLLGWQVDEAPQAAQMPATGYRLLFIDPAEVEDTDLAINSSELVVFLGRAPSHGRFIITGKSIIWLQTPLDIVQLEHVIVSAG